MNITNTENLGLIHVYCGDGKGKTTAAMGLCLRAAGHGKQVLVAQFLKSQPTGELTSLAQLKTVQVLRAKGCSKFSFQMSTTEKQTVTAQHNALLTEAVRAAKAGECQLLILDEIIGAYTTDLISQDAVNQLLASPPPGVELVLTGRDPWPQLLDAAHYVCQIQCKKHPYQQGISARKGIEY